MKASVVLRGTIFVLVFLLYLAGTSEEFSSGLLSGLPTGASPFLFFTRLLGGGPEFQGGVTPSLCPLLIVSTVLTLLLFWKKRLFCQFLCPVGFLFRLLYWGRSLFFSQKNRFSQKDSYPQNEDFCPRKEGSCPQNEGSCLPKGGSGFRVRLSRFSWVGTSLLLMVFMGVLFQIPFLTRFLMLDPLLMFGTLFQTLTPWQGPTIFLLGLLILALIAPRLWCTIGCPLGALQDGLYRLRSSVSQMIFRPSLHAQETKVQETNAQKVKEQEIKQSDTVRQMDSVPSKADASEEGLSEERKSCSRRSFFTTTFFSLTSLILTSLIVTGPLAAFRFFSARRFLPPGALEDPQFSTSCSACGRCIAACPTKHLVSCSEGLVSLGDNTANKESVKATDAPYSSHSSDEINVDREDFDNNGSDDKISVVFSQNEEYNKEEGVKGIWPKESTCLSTSLPLYSSRTPTVETRSTWCKKDCIICGQVCPTGAIRPFTLAEKKNLKVGLAEYNFEHCVLYMEKDCNICIRECPWEALDLVWSEEFSINIPKVDPQKCTGCGRCVVVCPGFDPIYHGENEEECPVCPPPKAFTIELL